MIKWSLPFFLFLILLIGCQNKNSRLPKGGNKKDTIISRETMILLLTDLHLTEAALAFNRNHGKDTKELAEQYYNALFSKYKTTRKNFSFNLEYYQKNQEKFMLMYEEVINRLVEMGPVKEKKK